MNSPEERALHDALHTEVLSTEALQRIRDSVANEWQAQFARSRRRHIGFAAVATLAVAAIAGWWSLASPAASGGGARLGALARFEAPGVLQVRSFARNLPLGEGAPLQVASRLDFRGDSLVELAGGGNLRVARESRLEIAGVDTVRLTRGELYVDIPPGARSGRSFVVRTDDGEFRHVGTQFALAIVDGRTRLRVREGSVRWHAGTDDATVSAGTEVLIDGAGTWTQRVIPTAGRDWAWVETMAPEFDIENRPLAEFLEWASRETGRRLVFADEGARRQVDRIRMHGRMHGLTIMESMSAVMGSTSLRVDLADGLIRVSSAVQDGS
jgi:ferric-dicitrate binding protein FerR (iron transport regulator)